MVHFDCFVLNYLIFFYLHFFPQQNNWNDEEKEKSLNEIENLLLALENQSDLKLDIIKTMHEELTARKRQLDASYRLVMNSKINDYNGLMNNKKNKNENSSNGRNSPAFSKDKDNGSCNGKRIRRGSNKNDNESNYDDGDDHSSTQMTNDRSNLVKKKRGLKNSNKRSKYDSNNYEQTEETYCLCAQVSYGDMIACDNKDCSIQWFHFCCVNLSTKPKGRWFCPNCRGERSNIPRK